MTYQIVFLALTYAVCAIPFGLVIAKVFAKTDIRQSGSKNIGATNVARVVGKKLGLVTLILDGTKGAVMIIIAKSAFSAINNIDLFLAAVSVIAVIGHVFPIYLKFKGGKGVATTAAVFLALNWQLGLLVLAVWIVVFAVFRISSLSSISAVTSSILISYLLGAPISQMMVCFVLFLIVLVRHKENIVRLINGEEGSFKKKKS